MLKVFAFIAFLLASSTWSSNSSAGSPGLEVYWDAPALPCPTQAEVLRRLETLLGGTIQEKGARYTIILRVRQESEQWHLKLWSIALDGTKYRTTSAADCDSLAELGVVITAFLIDPQALDSLPAASRDMVEQAQKSDSEQGPPPPVREERENAVQIPSSDLPGPEATDEAELRSVPRSAPALEAASARSSGPAVLFRLAAGASAGPLPSLAGVVELGGGLEWSRGGLQVALHGEFPRTKHLPDDLGATEVSLISGRLFGCRIWRARRFLFRGCAGGEAGVLVARGVGLQENRTSVGGLAALGLAPSVSLLLGEHLRLVLEGQALLNAARSRVIIDNFGLAHEPAWGTGRGLFGIEWVFENRPGR